MEKRFNYTIFLISYTSFCLPVIMSECEYFAPSIFLNHGGGPYPVLGEKNNLDVAASMKRISSLIDMNRLKSIIVVTAHREEDIVTISSGEKHALLYDYSNYPPECYKIKYDAPGNPTLAQELREAFRKSGIDSKLDDNRGWDHGVFIPMLLINPKANIPIIQLSILKNQNSHQHYEIGKVLYEFRKQGVAIFGSGMSYHNMAAFKKAVYIEDNSTVNDEFDNFLSKVCVGDVETRKQIMFWDEQNGAFDSHPLGEAEHLMPLIVNVGASGPSPGKKVFAGLFERKFRVSGFMWDGI